MYYPLGQKFARNRSISYSFRDIYNLYFLLNPRWPPKVSKKFFYPLPLTEDTLVLQCESKIRSKSLSHSFRDIFNILFSTKIQDGRQRDKIETFLFCIEHSYTTLWVKNSLDITLSLTVSKIFAMLYFPLKSKMAAKSGKN